MNVLSDFHHESLLYSLILLFEKRLGFNLYRPIGLDWYEKGFWMVYPARDTAEQYLSLEKGYQPKDGTAPLNDVLKYEDGVYYCHDIDSGLFNKAITFNKFKEMPIDIIIASIPEHLKMFKRLIREYKPKAKLIYQIGNTWNIPSDDDVKNIMASSNLEAGRPLGRNYVEYHQEFDRKIFDYHSPQEGMNIYSFMNIPQQFEDYKMFLELERIMKNWNFKAYGGQARDGNINGSVNLAGKMAEARFIWHVKAGGDGYGHIIHNVAAVGRPAIVKKEYYRGKLAENLMVDGKTCITIDGLRVEEIIKKINYFSDPGRYKEMCLNTFNNFKEKVNFDYETEDIKAFISRLR